MLEIASISSFIWFLIIITNTIISFIGFSKNRFFEKYLFSIYHILHEREYIRIISSGFLHVGWMHLLFNMYSFYWFGDAVENAFGSMGLLLIYFGSLVGGNLLSLYLHRYQNDYRAVGASGAVSGVIFSFVMLAPNTSLGLIFVPIPIPAWIFGILYTIISIFGLRSQSDNIGHDAHLGGAMTGMLISIILKPDLLIENGWLIGLLFGSFCLFLWLSVNTAIFTLPMSRRLNQFQPQRTGKITSREIDYRLQDELNELLDKMNAHGWSNLSDYEQRRLHYLAERLRK